MSYFSQMVGLTVQNFVSAATGIAVGGRHDPRLRAAGSADARQFLGRSHPLDPLRPAAAVDRRRRSFLVWQGVPQNLAAYVDATTLEGAQQMIAQGPVASQIAIKQLGTNGGGFFNANSAVPYENPTPLTNFLEMLYDPAHSRRLLLHVRAHGPRHAAGRGDLRRHARALRRRAGADLLGGDRRQSR